VSFRGVCVSRANRSLPSPHQRVYAASVPRYAAEGQVGEASASAPPPGTTALRRRSVSL